ncbi:MAG TPA: helix-turn-helix domain-containing protein [Allosphingosinicella sp.]|nr:helix-turn-helix domain-containing protein [Allosphingosinicella sp.]
MIEAEQEEIAADPVGSRLKTAREAQGMSLDDIAAKTRVPIRHLQHMEQGEWDALPATTYSVGFARAYASVVGLNAAEIGAALRAHLGAGQSVAAPSYYEPADPARVPPRSLAIAAAIIAVLLAAAYFIWRNNAVDDVDDNQVAAVETAPAATPPPIGAPVAAPMPGPTLTPVMARGPVVLTATSDVWLRVYEAGGHKLYENLLKAGDHYEVPANANRPQLLTGRPDALRVTIGGVAIPPLGQADKTIADLSLLPADLAARAAQPTPLGGAAPAAAAPSPTAPVPAKR